MKRLFILMLAAALVMLSGCGNEPDPYAEIPYPTVTITMEDGGVMNLELYPALAPNTVANFVTLAQRGFYDGLDFHRIVLGYIIQGGDPLGTGRGGAGYAIEGEFSKNGWYKNTLSHERGVISMARFESDVNSASSQFFIMQYDYPELDGDYAAFGRLVGDESFQTLDKIASTAVDASYNPLFDVKIRSVTVDTHGYQYTVNKIEN